MLCSYKEAQELTTLSRSQIERLVEAGEFPVPIRVTPGRVAFVRPEVVNWTAARIAARGARSEEHVADGIKKIDPKTGEASDKPRTTDDEPSKSQTPG